MNTMFKVEAPISDHLRDYAPDLKMYKAVEMFSVWKIEIRRTANFQ